MYLFIKVLGGKLWEKETANEFSLYWEMWLHSQKEKACLERRNRTVQEVFSQAENPHPMAGYGLDFTDCFIHGRADV